MSGSPKSHCRVDWISNVRGVFRPRKLLSVSHRDSLLAGATLSLTPLQCPGVNNEGIVPRVRTLLHVSPCIHNTCVSHTAIPQLSYTLSIPNFQAAYPDRCRPMAGTAPTDRRRKAHSKSRKGCLQCKRRHYKVRFPRAVPSGSY